MRAVWETWRRGCLLSDPIRTMMLRCAGMGIEEGTCSWCSAREGESTDPHDFPNLMLSHRSSGSRYIIVPFLHRNSIESSLRGTEEDIDWNGGIEEGYWWRGRLLSDAASLPKVHQAGLPGHARVEARQPPGSVRAADQPRRPRLQEGVRNRGLSLAGLT